MPCQYRQLDWGVGTYRLENVPGLMAHKPGETAICAGIAILGLIFLGLGVLLLRPRRDDPPA
jgi:hypothetical protein